MNHQTLFLRLSCGLVAAVLCAPAGALMQAAPSATPPATPPARTAPPTKGAPAGNPLSPLPPSKGEDGAQPITVSPGQGVPLQRPSREPNQPQTPVIQNSAPAVHFSPSPLDLGDLVPEVAKTGTVLVTNITDKPIKITKIQASCGCTTTTAPPGVVEPGQTTKVDITLKAPTKGGVKVSKNVTFMIEGYAPQVMAVEGFVKEYITVTPDLLTGPAAENPPPSTVRISSKEKTPVTIKGTVPDVLVAIPENSAETHDVEVDWAKWVAAGKPAKISILTDHPQAAQVTLLVKRSIADRGPTDNKAATAAANTAIPALVLATRDGNKDKVAEALKSGADIESLEPSSRRTALHFAADRGDVDMVKFLLAAKANPNAPDRTGRSPVTVAAEKKHAEVLKLLIAAGGDIEIRDQLGGTPVLWASGLGSNETVEILLQAGANPNVVDRQGMTPLIWAATIGRPEVVDLLIAKGADIKARDTMAGETALTRAVRTGATESVVLLLKKGSDLNSRNNLGMTPFLVACASGDLKKIQLLLEAGADKTAKDSRGWGAIDFARNRLDPAKTEVLKFLEPIVPASTATAPPQTKDASPTAAKSS